MSLEAAISTFVRGLRAAGMPVGPDQAVSAVRAVAAVGLGREDVRWALHAALVTRPEHRETFEQAFGLFWRGPSPARGDADSPPSPLAPEPRAADPVSRRVAEAFGIHGATAERRVEAERVGAWSDIEALRRRDFAQMSAEELALARDAVRRLRPALPDRPSRRFEPHPRGRLVDPRATLRRALREGSGLMPLAMRRRKPRPRTLVVLCDISGSMAGYSRMMLHYLHALSRARPRFHAFLFGTNLTNVTRALRTRDPDEALARVGAAVMDWSGGTRIGATLRTFNKDWSRRVLGGDATVLLITDGLDRDAGAGLVEELDRLRRSCGRLVWLNPLLRWEGYEATSSGARLLAAGVHETRPVHSLDSLSALADALAAGGRG
ncbi:MAG TPA: VWA domain-containing protein [Azospirillaceae bacterium]|nr:VWA domain-containing protein [Azospirillaceae bacterium]